MVSFTAMLLLAGAVMHAQAQDFSDLVGTWSSKSNSTFTGDVCHATKDRALCIGLMVAPGLLRPRQRPFHRAKAHRNQLLIHR